MVASSGPRFNIRRALVLGIVLAAAANWPDSGTAATGARFPAATANDRRSFDPFDESARQESMRQESAPQNAATLAKSQAATANRKSTVKVVRSDFHDLLRLTPIGRSDDDKTIVTDMATPVAFQRVAYQPIGAGAPSEPLPAPKSEYQRENSEEAAGSTWSARPICELSTDIVLPGGLLPKDHWDERPPQSTACGELPSVDGCGNMRGWPVNTFTWVPSCLCHNPLYFEEINLERYGYGCGCYGPCCSNCLQSAVSACHFFGTVPMLPWKMAVDCPGECDYALGYYRPGSCPPWRYNCCTRCSGVGALAESGAAVGLIFLIP